MTGVYLAALILAMILIYAGTLMREGVATERDCDVAIARPITDDPDMQRSIMELVKAIF